MKSIIALLSVLALSGHCQEEKYIQIGTFNIEWFPCKDDGEMMKKYGIELRYPPQGNSTDIRALFAMLKDLDIELLAVQEIVDPEMLEDSAKACLGDHFEVIYSPHGGAQKIGFLYNSNVLEVVGPAETYTSLLLEEDSRLRPAFRVYFRFKPGGFDFHAIVVHLKASPTGWDQRRRQWEALERILTDLPEETKDQDIILLGDMNNVTEQRTGEFDSLMERLSFFRATSEVDSLSSNYWQPDYRQERIQSSLIDHIFVSSDAKIEYLENSMRVGGICADGKTEYTGEAIPRYYEQISDHCPVFGTFRADLDSD